MQQLLMTRIPIAVQCPDHHFPERWVVVAEAIQTILRREGYPKPYEALLELTRTNENINKDRIHTFIESLDIDGRVKDELKAISPFNYTGK